MLLCKIMLKQSAECKNIVQGKLALKYQGRPIDAILAVANACIEGTVVKVGGFVSKWMKKNSKNDKDFISTKKDYKPLPPDSKKS